MTEFKQIKSARDVTKTLIEENVIEDPMSRGIRKSHTMKLEEKVLELFCSDNPPQNRLEYLVRGMVFCGTEMILQGFPYSEEHIIVKNQENKFLEIFYSKLSSDWVCTEAIEGTLIRVFFFDNKWFVTTHRKLDAFKSKWGNERSFGEIFKDAILRKKRNTDEKIYENFFSDLNKQRQYTFLITATNITRFVCNANKDLIVYLYAVTEKLNGTTKMVDDDDEEMLKWKTWKQDVINVNSKDKLKEAIEFVSNLSFPFKCQGLLLFNTKTFESYKLVNSEYQECFDIRGNIPSVPFAYLHIMNDPKKVKIFRKIISEKDIEIIDKYDRLINELVIELHSLYIQRHVEKNRDMKTDPTKHKFLLGLHGWFLTQCEELKKNMKEKNAITKIRVTQKVVSNLLLESDPPVINKLIREKINPSLIKTSTPTPSPESSPQSSAKNSPVRM